MLCCKSNPPLFPVLLLLFTSSTFVSFSHGAPHLRHLQHQRLPPEVVDERDQSRRMAETSNESTSYDIILAANRTHRRDPSDGFRYYTRGWDLANPHYLYSVAFSAAPPFFIAGIWFLIFGLCLCCICLRHCCCFCFRRQRYGYSRTAHAFSLIFLIVFTIVAIAGIAFLYTGEVKFQSSIVDTLSYILHEADTIIVNLRNLFNNLLSAKNIAIGQISLTAEQQGAIDNIGTTINSIADEFHNVTGKNSNEIRSFLDPMKLTLIYVAVAMLVLELLGFLISILGMQCLVYCLVSIGWILVAGTFIMSGMFLLVHNVVADTCIAMDEWLLNPTADSALGNILPKIDNKTAEEISSVTKGVTFGVVNVLNGAINNVSNVNLPPNTGPLYYNQSGPLIPILCNPYNSDLTDRQCASGEVDFTNASEAWKNYICQASSSGICTTPGRLTPHGYSQMTASVNVSYGLYCTSPFLLNLMDNTFLKETFTDISKDYCPDLRRYTLWTYVGFITSSCAVMLSLILWIVYAREQRNRAYTKKFITRPPGIHFDRDKAP